MERTCNHYPYRGFPSIGLIGCVRILAGINKQISAWSKVGKDEEEEEYCVRVSRVRKQRDYSLIFPIPFYQQLLSQLTYAASLPRVDQ